MPAEHTSYSASDPVVYFFEGIVKQRGFLASTSSFHSLAIGNCSHPCAWVGGNQNQVAGSIRMGVAFQLNGREFEQLISFTRGRTKKRASLCGKRVPMVSGPPPLCLCLSLLSSFHLLTDLALDNPLEGTCVATFWVVHYGNPNIHIFHGSSMPLVYKNTKLYFVSNYVTFVMQAKTKCDLSARERIRFRAHMSQGSAILHKIVALIDMPS